MKKEIIEITEEINLGNVILEKGDKIKIIQEDMMDVENEFEAFVEEKLDDLMTDIRENWLNEFDDSLVGMGPEYTLYDDDIKKFAKRLMDLERKIQRVR